MDRLDNIKSDISDFLTTKGLITYFGDNIPTQHQDTYIKFDKIEDQDSRDIEDFLSIFKEEINKYSNTFFKKTKVKVINLVKNLRINSHTNGSFTHVSATVDPQNSSLILSINHKPSDNIYKRKCIHHELFHLVEINLHGTFEYYDTEWVKLNSISFKYGEGGWTAYSDKNFVYREHPHEGFVSSYAMLGVDEDRAETFMYIQTNALYSQLEKWMQTDAVLHAKVKYMKDLIDQLSK